MNVKLTKIFKKTQYLISTNEIIAIVVPRTFFNLTPSEKDQVIASISDVIFSPEINFEPMSE